MPMATPEYRARVMQNTKARNLWYAALIVQGLGMLNALYALITGTKHNIGNANAGLAVIFLLLLVLLFMTALFVGILRFGQWVMYLIWFALALVVLNFDIIGIAVMLFVALAYRFVLKVAQGVTPAAPAATPPSAPPAVKV